MAERTSFPSLRIDPRDVCGSWKSFVDRFTVAVRYEVCNRGMRRVDEDEVPGFNEEMKLCALLKAISNEGFQVLQAQGIEINDPELTYQQVMQALKNTYEREESLNVKLWNFTSARQQTGEDSRDFVRRVEHMSRTTGIFKTMALGINADQTRVANAELDRVRRTMAQVIVVNGLQDLNLRRELMAKHDLTWETLSTILTCRGAAQESTEKLERPAPEYRPVSTIPIKQEVGETRFTGYHRDDSRSRYDKHYGDESSRYGNSRGKYRSPSQNSRSDRRDASRHFPDWNRSSSRGNDNKRNFRRDDRVRRSISRDRNCENRGDYYNRNRSDSRENKYRQGRSNTNSCYQCGNPNHRIRFCPHVVCHFCTRKGHISRDCQDRSNSKERENSRERHLNRKDSPPPNRSGDPSPYPERGNKSYPNHYVQTRNVNVSPDKLFGNR